MLIYNFNEIINVLCIVFRENKESLAHVELEDQGVQK